MNNIERVLIWEACAMGALYASKLYNMQNLSV
jgi:hypothetical protein